MAQISIVKLKDIKQAKRFDAEYFKPEYLEVEEKIKRNKWNFLLNLCDNVLTGKTPKYSEKGTIPVVRSGDLRKNIIDVDTLLKTNYPEDELFFLKKDDILISSIGKGSIGKIAINFETIKLATVSEVSVIRNLKIIPSFLQVLLLTKFGQKQIERYITGATGQLHLLPSNIRKLLIPLLPQPFQLQIEKIVKEAYQKQSLSKQLYKEAEQLLLEELGLLNYKPKHTLTFTTTKKEINQAQRFDAEYFQPKYKEIIKKIENYEGGFDELGNIGKFKNGSFISDKYYSTKGKRFYIRIKELSLNSSFNKDEMIRISDNFIRTNETVVEENDFVFATIGNTIGKVNLITKEFSGSFPSNNTSRFRLKKIVYPYFYELLFRSFVIQEQIQRYFTQTAQPKISNNQLEKIKIPLIKSEIQKQISQKIQQSHRLRKESKELLEQAKKMVEEEIEKN